MTIRNLFVLVLAGGCGAGNNPTQPSDASELDAPEIDALPDATPIDAPPGLAVHRYVIDAHDLPANNAQALALGLDLDNDTVVDNQLGRVLATFAGQGFDSQGLADSAIDRGEILTLAELESIGFASGEAGFTLHTGTNPQPAPCLNAADPVCRRHLDGNGMFDVASAPDEPLAGTFASGVFLSGSGRLHVGLSLMSVPATYELVGARVKLTAASDTGLTGIIAGAIAQTEIDTILIPNWALEIDAMVVADCAGAPPNCACTPNSQGNTFRGLFDANDDCRISAEEVRTDSLVQSLLAPDVTIDGTPAISIGFGFAAKRATFTP